MHNKLPEPRFTREESKAIALAANTMILGHKKWAFRTHAAYAWLNDPFLSNVFEEGLTFGELCHGTVIPMTSVLIDQRGFQQANESKRGRLIANMIEGLGLNEVVHFSERWNASGTECDAAQLYLSPTTEMSADDFIDTIAEQKAFLQAVMCSLGAMMPTLERDHHRHTIPLFREVLPEISKDEWDVALDRAIRGTRQAVSEYAPILSIIPTPVPPIVKRPRGRPRKIQPIARA